MMKRRKYPLTEEQYKAVASYRRAKREGREPTEAERAANASYIREWNKANPERVKAITAKSVGNGKNKRAYERKKADPVKWERVKAHSRAQHEKFWDKKQDQRLALRYGVPREQIAAMRERPCEICGTFIPREKRRGINRCMVIDHCHATGRLRGSLCGSCNTAIGLFKDNLDLLARAADYLKQHSPP